MATEPDDYQTISDNCPGYMVLISEGIICTRCAGEKRHKANDCPKPATAANLATDKASYADQDGYRMGNSDSGMESLSDADSISSESTASSDGSESRVTNVHQSDKGGDHLQNAHLSRRGFARSDASHTSTKPDRISPSPTNPRAARKSSQVYQTFTKADGLASDRAAHKPGVQSLHRCDVMYGFDSPASAEANFLPRSGTLNSTGLPSNNKHFTMKKGSDKTQEGSRSHDSSSKRFNTYKATDGRSASKSRADTIGKFEYSNTTCPSSFGFGRLPSDAMG